MGGNEKGGRILRILEAMRREGGYWRQDIGGNEKGGRILEGGLWEAMRREGGYWRQ